MREIKFRVFDKDYKKMHIVGKDRHDSLTCWDGQVQYYNLQNGEGSGEHGSYILMQFTGLTDKNGKEIYEKDILDFDNRKHIVTFDNGGFGIWKDVRVDLYSNQMRKLHEPLWNLVVDECEVIGNIYEHPHLLEESE